jgi:hypothetical protein
MSFHLFPAEFVFWKKNENHDKIKSILMNEIKKSENSFRNNSENIGLNNAYSSYSSGKDMSNWLINSSLSSVLWDCIDEIVQKMGSMSNQNDAFKLKMKESFISEAWYTIYNKDGNFEIHSHDNSFPIVRDDKLFFSSFSAIYILNDENDKNATVFRSFGKGMPFNTSGEYSFDTSSTDEIGEGTMIVFPATLLHSVKNVKMPGRITIAFNVQSTYD